MYIPVVIRALFTRLFSASLIGLIVAGGGGLPVLDGVLFHNRERAADALRPHFETTSGCHSDGCAIRTTAHQVRLAAVPGGASIRTADPDRWELPGHLPEPFTQTPSGQPLSRAPPRLG